MREACGRRFLAGARGPACHLFDDVGQGPGQSGLTDRAVAEFDLDVLSWLSRLDTLAPAPMPRPMSAARRWWNRDRHRNEKRRASRHLMTHSGGRIKQTTASDWSNSTPGTRS